MRKIPKIIHQIWFDFGNGKDMGKHNKELVRRAMDKNNDYFFILWREENAENLIKKCYPKYWMTYNMLEPIIKKVDYLRFFILHKYGGIYLDIDYYCIRPFDDYFRDNPIDNNKDIILSYSCYGDWVTNSIMMSRKNSPFWIYCMDRVKDESLFPIWGDIQQHIEISCTAGPYFMTEIFKTYKGEENIRVVPPPIFLSKNFNDAIYSWHEGHTSWINPKDFICPKFMSIFMIIIVAYFLTSGDMRKNIKI